MIVYSWLLIIRISLFLKLVVVVMWVFYRMVSFLGNWVNNFGVCLVVLGIFGVLLVIINVFLMWILLWLGK